MNVSSPLSARYPRLWLELSYSRCPNPRGSTGNTPANMIPTSRHLIYNYPLPLEERSSANLAFFTAHDAMHEYLRLMGIRIGLPCTDELWAEPIVAAQGTHATKASFKGHGADGAVVLPSFPRPVHRHVGNVQPMPVDASSSVLCPCCCCY